MGEEFYTQNYNSFSKIISFLKLGKVYSSPVFFILLLLFIVNLIGCTLKILPSQLKRLKKDYFLKPTQDAEELYADGLNIDSFLTSLKKKGYKLDYTENGCKASKHRIGSIGSSVTHLGIIIIMLAGFIGSLLYEEGFFNMLPGDVKNFHEYNFALRLDDFYLKFRENSTVEQYYSELTVLEHQGEEKREKIWVNNPLKVKNLNFYQTSYGWASKLIIKDKNNEVIESKLLRNKETYFFQKEHLTIQLYGYFPDFVLTKDGEPLSMSEQEKNPYYAVIVYQFNNYVDSYILEPSQAIIFKDYEISFDNSMLYTGITYNKDFGYLFVLIGSIILMMGLALSFYYYPKFIIVDENSIKTATRQNSWGYNYQIKKYIEEIIKDEVKK